ncbi:cation transport ATPase, putative, partial [Ixodes scapularis]
PPFANSLQPVIQDLTRLPHSPLLVALATCHSLHMINGEMVGYSLDTKTFQAIDWVLEEPESTDAVSFERTPARIVRPRNMVEVNTSLLKLTFTPVILLEQGDVAIGIVRQFPFESQLQRASVVITPAGSNRFQVYAKGAPETIIRMCAEESVPSDFTETLETYTRHGLRILAVASKVLPDDTTWDQAMHLLPRVELEYDLQFRGFVILQNKLKPESAPTIATLEEASIKTIMATGKIGIIFFPSSIQCHKCSGLI